MEEKEEEEEENIPHMCESIGHQPVWGHCPKGRENTNQDNEELLTKGDIDTQRYEPNHNLLRQRMGTANHRMLLRL